MTDWLDLCLYCGCAGWDQQDSISFVNNAAVHGKPAPVGGGEVVPRAAGLDVAGSGEGEPQQQQHEQQQLQQQQLHQQLQLRPRLFCADCGECFHSWCTTAPVRTMDDKAVCAWRCPNCKVRGELSASADGCFDVVNVLL